MAYKEMERQRDLEERTMKIREEAVKPKPEKPIKPSALQEKIQALIDSGMPPEEAKKQAVLGRTPTVKPPVPKKPTQFEQKKTVLDGRLARKEITQEQYDEALWGIKSKPVVTRQKGASTRQANATFLKDVYNKADKNSILDEAKKAKARPIVRGIYFDMPFNYNWAVQNKQDGVATPEDEMVIQKYDQMFKFFQDGLIGQGIKKFKDFAKLPVAKDPDIDRAQIRKWFEIYRKY